MINGANMNSKQVYMDNAASTMPSEAVKQKIIETLQIYGNPSSQHDEGFKAKSIINESSQIISEKLNCEPEELYYTSGATMSNNLIIQGFLRKYPNGKILYSAIEHNDITMMADYFGKRKFIKIPVLHNGLIDITFLAKQLKRYRRVPVLCTIQAANSECGTVQLVQDLSKLVHAYPKTYLHSDVTQYIAHFECDVEKLGLDALSMSGQKINCIKGIGLLYISNNLSISPIIFGEQGLIGGTENVLGIACLGEAFRTLSYDYANLKFKRNYFIEKIDAPLVGSFNSRLPNNIYVISTKDAESMVVYLNEFGICASAGSACSSNDVDPSHVVLAMGYSEEEAKSCVRFTINNQTSYEDIDYVVDIFNRLNKV